MPTQTLRVELSDVRWCQDECRNGDQCPDAQLSYWKAWTWFWMEPAFYNRATARMLQTRLGLRQLCETARADVPDNGGVAGLLTNVIRARSVEAGLRSFEALEPRLYEMSWAQRMRLCEAVFEANHQLKPVQSLLADAIVHRGVWLPNANYCDAVCAAWFEDDDVDARKVLAAFD